MQDALTPKQVARAIQVSESSVKRWCDQGIIPTQYTAGGHRRIPLNGFLEFLRNSKRELTNPEVLGLPATSGRTTRVVERAARQLLKALLHGDEVQCRQIALDLYLAEHSISKICDEVFRVAFEEIGALWECGTAEIYQERRSCEISLRVLHELNKLLPDPPRDAPRAIGAVAEGDHYNIGTAMAELVLRDAKWNATSLGSNLPFTTLATSIRDERPRLFWLSCSHIHDMSAFLAGYSELYEEFSLEVAFVVGGRAITEEVRQQMKFAAYCDNMQHLEGFAQSLRRVIDEKTSPG